MCTTSLVTALKIHHHHTILLITERTPIKSTLFPYTTLFRSRGVMRPRRRLPEHETSVKPTGWRSGTGRDAAPLRSLRAPGAAADHGPTGAGRAEPRTARGRRSGRRGLPAARRAPTPEWSPGRRRTRPRSHRAARPPARALAPLRPRARLGAP